ncbi:hypothetical protein LTS18_009854 [Coniosporium uncinatum]|uniref:Uncharacterized protein n=1 Tax=Coniosporium uncinatum TaxID=93489 RepID=A0ACC3DM48_9PEZI|nr:hypothetical protein LTS18_009854 [Coniosporium uncinatum]
MAMHVDIVDCQIFAGANRLLGRSITTADSTNAQRRMREAWAPTARARDATFYALRFLSQTLVPLSPPSDGDVDAYHPLQANGGGQKQKQQQQQQQQLAFTYSAREDFLLNRAWVLYFATLVVWSYGFALDGAIRPLYALESQEERVRDMFGYLERVGSVKSPDELAGMRNRNACLGLLLLMKDMFRRTRWELAHEASRLLGKCVDMLCSQG